MSQQLIEEKQIQEPQEQIEEFSEEQEEEQKELKCSDLECESTFNELIFGYLCKCKKQIYQIDITCQEHQYHQDSLCDDCGSNFKRISITNERRNTLQKLFLFQQQSSKKLKENQYKMKQENLQKTQLSKQIEEQQKIIEKLKETNQKNKKQIYKNQTQSLKFINDYEKKIKNTLEILDTVDQKAQIKQNQELQKTNKKKVEISSVIVQTELQINEYDQKNQLKQTQIENQGVLLETLKKKDFYEKKQLKNNKEHYRQIQIQKKEKLSQESALLINELRYVCELESLKKQQQQNSENAEIYQQFQDKINVLHQNYKEFDYSENLEQLKKEIQLLKREIQKPEYSSEQKNEFQNQILEKQNQIYQKSLFNPQDIYKQENILKSLKLRDSAYKSYSQQTEKVKDNLETMIKKINQIFKQYGKLDLQQAKHTIQQKRIIEWQIQLSYFDIENKNSEFQKNIDEKRKLEKEQFYLDVLIKNQYGIEEFINEFKKQCFKYIDQSFDLQKESIKIFSNNSQKYNHNLGGFSIKPSQQNNSKSEISFGGDEAFQKLLKEQQEKNQKSQQEPQSLFGNSQQLYPFSENPTSSQNQGSSLFGNVQNNNQNQNNLFGNNNQSNTSNISNINKEKENNIQDKKNEETQQNKEKPTFLNQQQEITDKGDDDNKNKNPFQTNNNQNNTGGLFGNQTQQNQKQGLFSGNSSSNTGGLFGNQAQQNQNQATGGLFAQKQTNNTNGLFGNFNQQKTETQSGLFGKKDNDQQPPQQSGLFGLNNWPPSAPKDDKPDNNQN